MVAISFYLLRIRQQLNVVLRCGCYEPRALDFSVTQIDYIEDALLARCFVGCSGTKCEIGYKNGS